MDFGEKVRLLRNKKKLSQTELGKMCGLSLRTIRNYEVDGRYPKQREIYGKLASALGCEVNFLLTENDELNPQLPNNYTYKGVKEAEVLIAGVSALFFDSELSEAEKDAMMRALQDAYWIAKEQNKIAPNILREDD